MNAVWVSVLVLVAITGRAVQGALQDSQPTRGSSIEPPAVSGATVVPAPFATATGAFRAETHVPVTAANYDAQGRHSSSCRVPGSLPSTSRSVRVASGSLPSSSRSLVVPSQRFVPSAPALQESFRRAQTPVKPASRLCRTHEAAGVLPCSSRMSMQYPQGSLPHPC
jgi:hypothetical protein